MVLMGAHAWVTLSMVRVLLARRAACTTEAGFWFYRLGREVERLAVRPVEPLAKRGRKREPHDRAFHERTHGTPVAKRDRWTAIRKCWDTERAAPDHKHWSAAAIDGTVADKLNVGVRTVQRVRQKYLPKI